MWRIFSRERGRPITVSELRAAPFDEKLSVMGLLLSRLSESARKPGSRMPCHGAAPGPAGVPGGGGGRLRMRQRCWRSFWSSARAGRAAPRQGGRTAGQGKAGPGTAGGPGAGGYGRGSPRGDHGSGEDMDRCGSGLPRRWNSAAPPPHRPGGSSTTPSASWKRRSGQSQELVIFVTEVTAGYDTSWFVENFGCEAYFRHNRELLFDDTRHRIREEIAQARGQTEL